MNHEKDIPAEQPATQEKTRLSSTNAHANRTQGSEFAQKKGTQAGFRLRFPREVRLRCRTEFQKVYQHGARVSGRLVVVFAHPNGLQRCRMGVTASRKVGCAVVRARCRRLARELFRQHRHHLQNQGLDLVINARSSWARAPWADLEEDYLWCLRRIKKRLGQATM